MQTQGKLLQAKSRNKKKLASASSDCILPPSNSSINEQAPSLSISTPTPNTTIIETSVVSTQNEIAKTTPASQKRTRLSSGKIFDKDLGIWCLGPNENIKKKKTDRNPFLSASSKKVMETYLFIHCFFKRSRNARKNFSYDCLIS